MEQKAKKLKGLLAGRVKLKVSEVTLTSIRIENDMDYWREFIERRDLLPFCERNGLELTRTTSRGAYDYLITKKRDDETD